MDQRPPVDLGPPVRDLVVVSRLDPPVGRLTDSMMVDLAGLSHPVQGHRLHCRQQMLTLAGILRILQLQVVNRHFVGCAPRWLLQWWFPY